MDSSVLLRLVVGDSGKLKEWNSLERRVCSELVEVESLRTIDRYRVVAEIGSEEAMTRRGVLHELLSACEMIPLNRRILVKAAESFPVVVGTLDAIHLASALVFRDESNQDMTMATHDRALARGARAHGLEVIGV